MQHDNTAKPQRWYMAQPGCCSSCNSSGVIATTAQPTANIQTPQAAAHDTTHKASRQANRQADYATVTTAGQSISTLAPTHSRPVTAAQQLFMPQPRNTAPTPGTYSAPAKLQTCKLSSRDSHPDVASGACANRCMAAWSCNTLHNLDAGYTPDAHTFMLWVHIGSHTHTFTTSGPTHTQPRQLKQACIRALQEGSLP